MVTWYLSPLLSDIIYSSNKGVPPTPFPLEFAALEIKPFRPGDRAAFPCEKNLCEKNQRGGVPLYPLASRVFQRGPVVGTAGGPEPGTST